MSLGPNQSPNLAPGQPSFGDPNLAPLPPLLRAQKQVQFIKKQILDLLKKFRAEMQREGQTEEWRKRRLSSQANELFFRGYQKLRPADLTNTWRIIDPKPVHFTLNEFQFWVVVNEAKWAASKVDFAISGIPEDDEDAESQAHKIRNIARYYNDRFWTRTVTIKASKQAQFTGYLIAYTYFNPQAGVKAYRPVVERMSVKMGPDAFRCADCGEQGEMPPDWQEQAQQGNPALCPGCGSQSLDVTEVPTEEFDVQTGEEPYDAGDVETRLLSIYNVTWDAGLGIERSPIVLWEEDHDKDDIEAAYPGFNLSGDRSTTDTGLLIKQNLEHIGREDHKRQRSTLTRMWVDPQRYHNVELEEGFETVAGINIPAGTKLIELFPDGFHAIMQGDLLLDIYAAKKNDDLSVMEYHAMSDGGLAQGIDAMREPQRMTNTGYSLWNLWLRHQAAPPKRYNPDLVDPGDMSGDPTRPIPVNAANLGLNPGATMENAIVMDPPVPLPGQVFEGLNRMRAFIQFAALATEFSEGLPNVSNETLGGARIGQSLSQSISGTILAQFADFRCSVVKQTLKKVRAHCWDKRYLQLGGKYSTIEKIELERKDIPDDFNIETVPNSWLPRTAEQRQANFQALMVAAGGWQGLMMMPPEMIAEMCEIYDVRLEANMLPVTTRIVRMYLKQATQLLPSLQQAQAITAQMGMAAPMQQGMNPQMGMPAPAQQGMNPQAGAPGLTPPMQQGMNPQAGAPALPPLTLGQQLFQALQPAFNPRAKGAGEAAEYISAWFLTDEALEAPPEIIEFAGVLQDAYIQSASMQGAIRANVEAAGQPMPMEGAGPQGPAKPASPTPQPGALAQGGG